MVVYYLILLLNSQTSLKKYFPSLNGQLGGLELNDLEKYLKIKYDNSIKNFELENIRDINLFRYRKW